MPNSWRRVHCRSPFDAIVGAKYFGDQNHSWDKIPYWTIRIFAVKLTVVKTILPLFVANSGSDQSFWFGARDPPRRTAELESIAKYKEPHNCLRRNEDGQKCGKNSSTAGRSLLQRLANATEAFLDFASH